MIILIQVEFQGLSRHGKRTLENYGFSRVSKTLLTPPFFVRQLRQNQTPQNNQIWKCIIWGSTPLEMTKWSTFTYLLGSHKQLLPADLCPPTSTRYLVTCLSKAMRSKCGVSIIHINKQIIHKHRYQVDIKAIHMDNTLVYREVGLSTGIIIIIIIIILNKLVRASHYTLKSVWVFSILLSLSLFPMVLTRRMCIPIKSLLVIISLIPVTLMCDSGVML